MSIERHDAAAAETPDRNQVRPRNASDISAWCVNYLAREMEVPPDRIDVGATFTRLGLDSVVRTNFIFAIEDWLNVTITSYDMFEKSTIAQLADHLAANAGKQTSGSAARGSSDRPLRAAGTVANASPRRGRTQPEETAGEGRSMRRLLIAIGIVLLLATALWLAADVYFRCCTPPI